MSDTPTGSDPIELRLLTPAEADKLVALIRRCYGDTYIDPAMYRVDHVRGLLEAGSLQSTGALVRSGGRLVGHMAIRMTPRGALSADAGMTLVDPEFRGRGLARGLAVGMARRAIALGLVGVHDYPVTVHGATQRLGRGVGANTGLMLRNLPADVRFEAMDDAGVGRSDSIIRWLPFDRAPAREVYLPAAYAEVISRIYASARLEREALDGQPLPTGDARVEITVDPRRQRLSAFVERSGADLGPVLSEALKTPGLAVAHVDLPLAEPSAPAATEALRAVGFFFAGVLPERVDSGDILRLQWLSGAAEATRDAVYEDEDLRELAAFIEAERATSR